VTRRPIVVLDGRLQRLGVDLAGADAHHLGHVVTHTLPSPILPVRAASTIASMVRSTSASVTTTATRILGRKSTLYSAPR
jgi:hypothetical protein